MPTPYPVACTLGSLPMTVFPPSSDFQTFSATGPDTYEGETIEWTNNGTEGCSASPPSGLVLSSAGGVQQPVEIPATLAGLPQQVPPGDKLMLAIGAPHTCSATTGGDVMSTAVLTLSGTSQVDVDGLGLPAGCAPFTVVTWGATAGTGP
jgi:hypothetical protein